ncbi:MAG: hypothetical protein HY551_04135, partial [Elusimicrobia bacterium]|nr:hypothetical protein [Elusimicrobiota bacterium]
TFQNNVSVPPPEYPTDSQFARLDGTVVTTDEQDIGGKIIDRIVTLEPPSGTVNFSPQTLTSKDGVSGSGSSAAFAPTPCGSGTSCALTGGTLIVPIDIPMPNSNLGGTVIVGSATILSGNISNTVQDYSLTLTGGSATETGNFDGGTVTADAQGNAHYVRTVTFRNLTGLLANSSESSSISSPLDASNQTVAGLSLYVRYVVSPINLGAASFTFDIATIAIRGMIFSDKEEYNPAQNTWSFEKARGAPRFNHSATLLPNANELYFGGRNCDNAASPADTCAAFQPLSGPGGYIPQPDKFSTDSTLNQSRSHHAATVLPDGKVLVSGGVSGSAILSSSELYDPASKTWTQTGALNIPRAGHVSALLPNGTVLVSGGYLNEAATATTRAAEIYYPDSGRWVMTGVMVSSRQAHTATLLPDGNVLVAGGSGNNGYLNTVEIYFSTAALWVQVPNMTLAAGRADHTATRLHDGKVLLVGGINAGGVVLSAETYDPAAHVWSAVTSMPGSTGRGGSGRYAHTANLLRDGRVVVLGGDDGFGEIFAPLAYYPWSGAGGSWQEIPVVTSDPDLVAGIDFGIGRLRHTTTLLPDGTLLLAGGITASQSSLDSFMAIHTDSGIIQEKKQGLTAKRSHHTTALLRDGRVLHIGGADTPSSQLAGCESRYYGPNRDAATPAVVPAVSRIPDIQTSPSFPLERGSLLTVGGGNFKGGSEASGGGAASQHSAFHTPRLYLQAVEAPSGYLLDLSTSLYTNPENSWSKVNSSITIHLPGDSGFLAYGWYHVRVAANAQFSDAASVQIGPPKPTMTAGLPVGNAVDPTVVSWSWSAAPGCPASGVCEGYHVYSATNSVFLSTVGAACPGGTCRFLQTGLGAGSVASIQVAAYNISGDGPTSTSTTTIITDSLVLSGVNGLAISTGTIAWAWSNVPSAVSYRIFSATSNTVIGTSATNAFTQVGLSTNSPASILVRAESAYASGPLGASTTIYTLAWPPAADAPALTNLSTGGFTVHWLANTNPSGTNYRVSLASGTTAVVLSTVTAFTYSLADRLPNTLFTVQAAAINGNGVMSDGTLIASTYTLANSPSNPAVAANTPSALALTWGA